MNAEVQEVFTEPRDRLAEVEAERDRWAARVKELERRASVAVTALEGGPVYPKAARDIVSKEQVAKLAANGCMIVASGEWVARESTPGEALAAWQSKAAGLEVENAKLRAELKRLRGEAEPTDDDEPKPVDLDDAYKAIAKVIHQRNEAREENERVARDNERLRTDLASAEEALRKVDGELTALAEENEKLRAELRSEISGACDATDAVARLITERDRARRERDDAEEALGKTIIELDGVREALGADDAESTLEAARRVREAWQAREREAGAERRGRADACSRRPGGAGSGAERAGVGGGARGARRDQPIRHRCDASRTPCVDRSRPTAGERREGGLTMEEHEEEPRDHIEDVRERHGIYTRASVDEAGGVAVYPVTAVGALLDEHDRLRARVVEVEAALRGVDGIRRGQRCGGAGRVEPPESSLLTRSAECPVCHGRGLVREGSEG